MALQGRVRLGKSWQCVERLRLVGQSRWCKLWRVEVLRVLAGLGSHGLLRLGMSRLVKTRLGKAVKILRGMSRLNEERLVRARLGKAV